MWRDGQRDLTSRLERTGGRGRQFIMRRRILVIHVTVNDQLIAKPLVIEGHKSTIVFNLWIGARELVVVEEGRPGSGIGVGRSGAQPIGTERCVTEENARQYVLSCWSEARRRRSASCDNLIVRHRQIFRRR